MKRFLLLFFTLCTFYNGFAQHFIEGKVVAENVLRKMGRPVAEGHGRGREHSRRIRLAGKRQN